MLGQKFLSKIADILDALSFEKSENFINHQSAKALKEKLNLSAKFSQSQHFISAWIRQYLKFPSDIHHLNFSNRMYLCANTPSMSRGIS
ncbi:hypothetical protein BBROOKSOX_389 [Bathymodiolus brooksi thiotrophic gill symbiont]|nr:hypothetical protein BBROOKSOX_389 [Bathymodiolus brooksi thiotrophic gill symbiont]